MIDSTQGLEPTRHRPRAGRRRPWMGLWVGLLIGAVACLVPTAASAELVVFTHGGYLKVTDYEVHDQLVRLRLLRGGQLQVPLLTIERIVEDEVSTRKAVVVPSPPSFALRFEPQHTPPSAPYGELIYEAAKRYDLNPALVAAVAKAESNFNPRAVSHKGACGLMQLMPATAQRFGIDGEQVFEPSRNLDAGSRYLRWLADRFEDRLAYILAAYNSGEGTVDRYDGVPPYKETRRYLRRIFDELGLPDPVADPAG